MDSLQKDGSTSFTHTKLLLYILGLVVISVALWLFIKYVPGLFIHEPKQAAPQEIVDFLNTKAPSGPVPKEIVNYLHVSSTTTVAAPTPPSILHFLKK